jgi:hypothetical protein
MLGFNNIKTISMREFGHMDISAEESRPRGWFFFYDLDINFESIKIKILTFQEKKSSSILGMREENRVILLLSPIL